MNIDHNILTILLLTPLVGAGVLALIPEREGSKAHHWAALIVTLLTLLFTLHLPFRHGFFTRRGGVSEGPFASLNCSLSSGDSREAALENRAGLFRGPSRRPAGLGRPFPASLESNR